MCLVSSWIKCIADFCSLTRLDLGLPKLSRSSIDLFEDHGRRRTQWWSRCSCLPVASSMTVQGSVKGSAQPAQSCGDGSFFNSSIRKFWSLSDFVLRFERMQRLFQSHGLATYHWWTCLIVFAPFQHSSIHKPSSRDCSIPSSGFRLRASISEIILLMRGKDEWVDSLWDTLVVNSGRVGCKILLKTKVKRCGLEWLSR